LKPADGSITIVETDQLPEVPMRISIDRRSLAALLIAASFALTTGWPDLASAAEADTATDGTSTSGAQTPDSRAADTAAKPAPANAGGCGDCSAAGGGCGCMQGAEGAAQAQMSPEAKAKRGCGCKHGPAH
jgi:hypothetical protein